MNTLQLNKKKEWNKKGVRKNCHFYFKSISFGIDHEYANFPSIVGVVVA